MSNLYVPLEEVTKILWKYKEEWIWHYVEEIETLATIDLSEDKTIQTIDTMIVEMWRRTGWNIWEISVLQELREKLYPNK